MNRHNSPEQPESQEEGSGSGPGFRRFFSERPVTTDVIALLALHLLIFAWVFPRMDLPVSDDANYFGFGKLFARYGAALYGDWSPLLTYFVAGLYKLLPLSWYGQFTVYAFLCRLLLLLGMYALILRFTQDRLWAFLSTLLAAVCFNYWLHENARAFTSGIFLLLLAWIGHRRKLDLGSAVSIVSLAVLLRPEFGLLAAGFVAVSVWNSWRENACLANPPLTPPRLGRRILTDVLKPTRITVLLLILTICAWTPLLTKGRLSTNRLTFAFAQKFRDYTIEYKLLDDPETHWNAVLDEFFPPGRRGTDSIIARVVPLYEIVSANPSAFARFVAYNARPFFTARFRFCQSKPLSFLINGYVYLSFLIFVVLCVVRPRQSYLLLFSLLFLLTVAPCLLTRPYRDYIFPTVLWFFCVIPHSLFGESVWKRYFPIAFLAVAMAFQIPVWQETFAHHAHRTNWKRAQVYRLASESEAFQGKTIAEAYPVFCDAFSDDDAFSVQYSLATDDENNLRAHQGRGQVINYILFEKDPPPHLVPVIEQLQAFVADRHKVIVEKDGFSLIEVLPPIIAPPNQAIVTDNPGSRLDLSGGQDTDPADARELTIAWNFAQTPFRDTHIYVSVDRAPYQYLGRTDSDTALQYTWKIGVRLVEPDFVGGPQFGRSYRFKVFAILPKDMHSKPRPLTPTAPIRFLEQ